MRSAAYIKKCYIYGLCVGCGLFLCGLVPGSGLWVSDF